MTPMEYQLAFSAAVLIPAAVLTWAVARSDRDHAAAVRIDVISASRLQELVATLISAGQRFEVRPMVERPGAFVLPERKDGAALLGLQSATGRTSEWNR